MAVLQALPSKAIIDGFKGKIDFYLHQGVAVARKWPRSPGKHRSPAVEAQWPLFSYAAKEWVNLSAEVQAAYYAMAEASGLNARDLQMRPYLSNLFRNPLE